MDKARAAVEALQDQKQQAEGKASSPTPDLPFGRDSKRIFESAAEARPLALLRYPTLTPCLLCTHYAMNAADITKAVGHDLLRT